MAEITARKSLSGRNVFTMEIKIEKTKTPKAKPVDETKLGFGHIFTDHMFVMEYDTGKGWHDARIVPYGDISISPAATVLRFTYVRSYLPQIRSSAFVPATSITL